VKGRSVAFALVVGGIAVWSWLQLDLAAARPGAAPGALAQVARDAWPPDTTPDFMGRVGAALLETIQIAYLATLLGAALSLPLAMVAARNLAPAWLVVPARLTASAIRVLPSLLWAIIAVRVFGLGPLAGFVAMTFYTIGYLAKFQYEAFEGLPRDALDAVRAMGVGRFRQAWHVALPEAGNALRSQLLFMLEYNVRASSIIGIVGAGGIGQTLSVALRFAAYDQVLTIIVAMFLTVIAMDGLSLVLRRRFIELGDAPRARLLDLFRPGRAA
jgi:phosphonate transport system permease protein